MFKDKFKKKPNQLEEEYKAVLHQLATLSADSKEYTTAVNNLKTLQEIRRNQANCVDVNKAMAVSGNLLGIAMILNFERVGTITSKALGFVIKGRI